MYKRLNLLIHLCILLKTRTELELIYFIQLVSQHRTLARDFNSQIEKLLEFQNAINIEINWVLMKASWICLRFTLDFSDINFSVVDFSGTGLDLQDTDIRFFGLQDLLKTSSTRRLQVISWRLLEDVSSVTNSCLSRCLQNVLKTTWKMRSSYAKISFIRSLQDMS